MKWVYVSGGALLLGVLSFVIIAQGWVLAILWSLGAGTLSYLFVKLIDSYSAEPLGELAPMLIGGAIMGLTMALRWLVTGVPLGWLEAAAVQAAVGAAWGAELLFPAAAVRPCDACRQPIARDTGVVCPRCKLTLCTRPECWNSRYARCQNCHERGVNLFPIDAQGRSANERWWRERLGPRVSSGVCDGRCAKEAGDADLRGCGNCTRPTCTACWDYYNGQCQRCQWVLPHLPPELRPFLSSSAPPAAGQAHERRRFS